MSHISSIQNERNLLLTPSFQSSPRRRAFTEIQNTEEKEKTSFASRMTQIDPQRELEMDFLTFNDECKQIERRLAQLHQSRKVVLCVILFFVLFVHYVPEVCLNPITWPFIFLGAIGSAYKVCNIERKIVALSSPRNQNDFDDIL